MKEQLALLPQYLTAHLQLTLLALAIGIGFSVPLGIALTRRPALEKTVVGIASVMAEGSFGSALTASLNHSENRRNGSALSVKSPLVNELRSLMVGVSAIGSEHRVAFAVVQRSRPHPERRDHRGRGRESPRFRGQPRGG